DRSRQRPADVRCPRHGAGTRELRGPEEKSVLPEVIGLHVAVDGYGLARPRAGVAVYTKEILHAMAVDRPDCRMTVFLPDGVKPPETNSAIAYRPQPGARLIGRHVQWPERVRALKPDALF